MTEPTGMSFLDAIQKVTRKDMEGDPEWKLSYAGRQEAAEVMARISHREQWRNKPSAGR